MRQAYSCSLVYAYERRRYDEIRSLYVQQLAFNWMADSTTTLIRTSVREKISCFAEGDLEHATEVLSELLEIASEDGDIEAPASTSPAVSLF